MKESADQIIKCLKNSLKKELTNWGIQWSNQLSDFTIGEFQGDGEARVLGMNCFYLILFISMLDSDRHTAKNDNTHNF